MKQLRVEYKTYSLIDIAESLHVNYYDILIAMILRASEMLENLKRLDIHGTAHQYTKTCTDVLKKIQVCMNDRKQALLPYISDLYNKDAAGHNCGICSGACDIGHQFHLMQLHESHKELTKMLFELQYSALPLYSNIGYPEIYRELRNEMYLVDTIVKELFFLEESNLVPKILESQKKINVHRY